MATLDSIREQGNARARRVTAEVRDRAQHAAGDARRTVADRLETAAHTLRDAPAPTWLAPGRDRLADRMADAAQRTAPRRTWRERLSDPVVILAAAAVVMAVSSLALVVVWSRKR